MLKTLDFVGLVAVLVKATLPGSRSDLAWLYHQLRAFSQAFFFVDAIMWKLENGQ